MGILVQICCYDRRTDKWVIVARTVGSQAEKVCVAEGINVWNSVLWLIGTDGDRIMVESGHLKEKGCAPAFSWRYGLGLEWPLFQVYTFVQ